MYILCTFLTAQLVKLELGKRSVIPYSLQTILEYEEDYTQLTMLTKRKHTHYASNHNGTITCNLTFIIPLYMHNYWYYYRKNNNNSNKNKTDNFHPASSTSLYYSWSERKIRQFMLQYRNIMYHLIQIQIIYWPEWTLVGIVQFTH